jgi:phosphoribosylformylglycinamidine synthase subunit PurS
MNFNVKVYVSIKESVLDPQGKTVNEALHHLGYSEIDNTRIGKYITFTINADNKEKATERAKEASLKVLTNPIIEKFEIEVEEQ